MKIDVKRTFFCVYVPPWDIDTQGAFVANKVKGISLW